jgi:hypothetical protein
MKFQKIYTRDWFLLLLPENTLTLISEISMLPLNSLNLKRQHMPKKIKPKKQKQKNLVGNVRRHGFSHSSMPYQISSVDSDKIHSIATSVFGSSYYISYEKMSHNV